jgi:predicted nuclease of predicted toxin-antitoxin system
MKFLVDMPLSPELATWLRSSGHDAVHAGEIGLDRASDVEIIQAAIAAAQTIVTADLDYPRLLATAGLKSPSLILFRDGNWTDAEVVQRMDDVLRMLSESEVAQSIIVVERNRLRRRRLPVVP